MAQTGNIISFIILIIVIGVAAVVGFVAYQIAHDVGHNTKQKLEKKHVSFSRDGMKVGVKERTLQHEEDAAQRYALSMALSSISNHFLGNPRLTMRAVF
jgi:hypothetical protein